MSKPNIMIYASKGLPCLTLMGASKKKKDDVIATLKDYGTRLPLRAWFIACDQDINEVPSSEIVEAIERFLFEGKVSSSLTVLS